MPVWSRKADGWAPKALVNDSRNYNGSKVKERVSLSKIRLYAGKSGVSKATINKKYSENAFGADNQQERLNFLKDFKIFRILRD